MSKSLPVGQALPKQSQAAALQSIGGLTFDWLMIFFCTWFTIGLFLDGWAHTHMPQLETFFTPWHAVLYSGYLSVALFLVVAAFRNHERGYDWMKSIPNGYGLSLLGAGIFAVGGVGDMTWHILFGIERNVEALLSPTHLILATGMLLMLTGPMRAAWRRPPSASTGWKALLPTLVCLLFVFSVFTFFTQYAHPFINLAGELPLGDNTGFGLISILFQAALLMALLLPIVRRFTLPFGAFTLVFTVNIALMSVLGNHYQLIPAAFLAGLGADILYGWLKPSSVRVNELRIFAFAAPAFLYLCYFINLELLPFLNPQRFYGIQWSIHLWLGAVFMAGIIGFLLSYLVAPPQGPAAQT